MLRRQNTKSRSDLHRRKSTTSVHSVELEHIDPAVAQRDAKTAAHQAFTRAQDRSRPKMSLFPPPPLAPSPRRALAETGNNSESSCRGSDNSLELHRRQSVRFVGPSSAQRKTPKREFGGHARFEILGDDIDPFQEHGEPSKTISERRALQNAENRLPSNGKGTPRIPEENQFGGTGGDYSNSFAFENEEFTPEDDVDSNSSSYRRLPSPRPAFKSETRLSHDGSSIASNVRPGSRRLRSVMSCRFLGSEMNKENIQPRKTPALRAPRSMNFLRNRRAHNEASIGRGFSDSNNRCSVDERQEHGLDTSHALALGPGFQTKGRGIPRSLRSSSSTVRLATPGANVTVSTAKGDSLRVKARKVSQSFRSRLKNLFSLGKSEEEPALFPDQHIHARKTHVVERSDGEPESAPVESVQGQTPEQSEDFASYLSPSPPSCEWAVLKEVPSGRPTLHAASSVQSIRSMIAVVENADSPTGSERKVSDDKSLTSWANSGPSTLTSQQQQTWREWERQRLSIITEHGAHAPSPSLRRPGIGAHVLHPEDGPASPGHKVDSQRVYSALMKRLQETKQLADVVEQQRKTSVVYADTDSATSSSPEEDPYSKASPASRTIRCVTPEVGGSALSRKFAIRSGQRNPNRNLMNLQKPTSKTVSTASEAQAGLSAGGDGYLAPPVSLPPPVEEHPGRAIADRSSAFFGSPTSHLFRSKSPYRKALQRSMEEEKKPMGTETAVPDTSSSDSGTQIHYRKTNNGGSGKPRSLSGDTTADSASVYSHHSDEITTANRRRDDVTPARLMDPPVACHPAARRAQSSISSIDWKSWLASNIARLEPFSPPKPFEVEYALPSMPNLASQGHVREATQIQKEDIQVQSDNNLCVYQPTFPTDPTVSAGPEAVKMSPFQRSVKRSSPPPGRYPFAEDRNEGPPPAVPPKSAWRPILSPSKRAPPRPYTGQMTPEYSGASSMNSSPGLTAAVERQFGAVSRYGALPSGHSETRRFVPAGHNTASGGSRTPIPDSSVAGSERRGGDRSETLSGDESGRMFI